MRKLCLPALCGILLLSASGCGAVREVGESAAAPVDNIHKNINYLDSTRKELRDTAGKNADQTNQQIDDILKKK